MKTPTTMQWIRTAGTRIYTGSSRLTTHYAARAVQAAQRRYRSVKEWLASSSGLRWLAKLALLVAAAGLLRKIVMKVGGGLYERLHSGAAGWLLWPAAALWIIAAYRAGHPAWKPRQPPAEQAAEDGQEQPAEEAGSPDGQDDALEQPPAGPVRPNLLDLRLALARVGTPHAHLAVLATAIGTTPELVRETLDKWQIPVVAVRMQDRGTSTGVKGGDAIHPALALDPNDADVVAAGQPGNNNSNNASFETVPDEKNPVRTHVIWPTQ
ncbi:hypothetical protein [Streptomyces tauricus]